jgi:hypothetical protein
MKDDSEAIIALIPGRYFVGIWYLHKADEDWMCGLFRDGDSGEWEIRYRFRYYNPESENPWDGKDRKSQVNAKCSASESEQDMIRKVDSMARLIAAAKKYEYDYLPLQTDSAEVIFEKLKTRPWAHIKTAPL